MPCYRCGTRQTDPGKGPSPWKRGVHGGAMVLICPVCQRDPQWTDELDHCPSCGSHLLSRTLGETTCKACAATVTTATEDGGAVQDAPGLSEEVSDALQRVFQRDPGL